MRAHSDDCTQRRPRIVKARAIGRAQADPEKAHFADRAGRKGFSLAEPPVRSDVLCVRFPPTCYQEIDIEQVTQGSSSSNAVTAAVVIGGAPSAATRTGRPNFPRLSLAARCDSRRSTNPRSSNSISTLSPGLRLSAFRNRAGITSCPLVESRELLMLQSYTSYRSRQDKRSEMRACWTSGL